MTFGESIKTCFNKYTDFTGTARRPEFWYWALFALIVDLALRVVDQRLAWAWEIASFLPYISVTTRRLHDTDRSGWFQLVFLVPILGWIIMFVLLAQEGKQNRYDPREARTSM